MSPACSHARQLAGPQMQDSKYVLTAVSGHELGLDRNRALLLLLRVSVARAAQTRASLLTSAETRGYRVPNVVPVSVSGALYRFAIPIREVASAWDRTASGRRTVFTM